MNSFDKTTFCFVLCPAIIVSAKVLFLKKFVVPRRNGSEFRIKQVGKGQL